jgi:hypothetical protein
VTISAGQFWLSLSFASTLLILSSIPTMARNCPRKNLGGASSM